VRLAEQPVVEGRIETGVGDHGFDLQLLRQTVHHPCSWSMSGVGPVEATVARTAWLGQQMITINLA